MKILVTGATGFIGSYLIEQLSASHEVYAIARQPLYTSNIHWIAQDLTQHLDQSKLPSQVDVVVHLAQSQHFREFPEQAKDIYDVNLHSTFSLLEYARKAGAIRFVFASSGGVYGYGNHPFAETDPITPIGFYQALKHTGEIIANSYQDLMNIIVLRYFFVYGKRQKPIMLIPRLAQSVYNGNPILLQGGDGIRINPTHINDAIDATVQAIMLNGNQIINVAGAETLSLREIVHHIAFQMKREPVFTVQPAIEQRDIVGDISKMKLLLHNPNMKFREGVTSLCDDIMRSQSRNSD